MAGPSTRLRLRVSPGASRSEVVGRHGEAWKVRVAAPPEGGKANDAVVDLLASTLGVSRGSIEIVSGQGSRDKTVVVDGLSAEAAGARLAAPRGSEMTLDLDLDHFRRELETERERLHGALEAVNHEGSLTEETGDLSNGPGDHIADNATETFMRELDEGLEENAEHLIAEIEGALRRIEDGTYGTCVVCGKPIGAERLEAVPYATLCIDDKRRQERG